VRLRGCEASEPHYARSRRRRETRNVPALSPSGSLPFGGLALLRLPLASGRRFLGSPAPALQGRELGRVGHGDQLEFLEGPPAHFLWLFLPHGSLLLLRHGERQLAFEDIAPLLLIEPDLNRVAPGVGESTAQAGHGRQGLLVLFEGRVRGEMGKEDG